MSELQQILHRIIKMKIKIVSFTEKHKRFQIAKVFLDKGSRDGGITIMILSCTREPQYEKVHIDQ